MAWTNLPLIDASVAAYVKSGNNFTLTIISNNIETIRGAIIKVTNIATGFSALTSQYYGATVSLTKTIGATKYYTMQIPYSAFTAAPIAGDSYQFSVRLSNTAISTTTVINDAWFDTQADKISAWSPATLLHWIDNPTILCSAFTSYGAIKTKLTGTFAATYDKLKQYSINNQIIYPKQTNVFDYAFTANGATVTLKYITEKGYQGSVSIPVVSESFTTDGSARIDACTAVISGDYCTITYTVKNKLTAKNNASIYIAKASSKDNYATWEVIYNSAATTLPVTDPVTTETAISGNTIDRFIEPGIAYKYKAYAVWTAGNVNYVTTAVESNVASYYLDDILLTDGDKTLYIQYNPEVTGFKHNIVESITPTLGGEYPIIKRNAKQKYKSFTLGGLISFYMNGTNTDFLNGYQEDNYVFDDATKELIKERVFRDAVIEFLLANDVKLFKSGPEGMMLVKLTNVSFSSNKTLGRNIYSFSAQATEIADCTFENYKKYIRQEA